MLPLTPADIVAWLGTHQFLDPAQVVELRSNLANFPDARALARLLLERDWLSPYQANQILQGKGDQLLLGPYRLRERLAEGAMGQVFKAWHPRMRRMVAIKTLHPELVASTKAHDRFFREIRLAAQLDHPHIVRALDADEAEGRPFLAMEFVEGSNLSALLRAYGPFQVPEAAEYARQAALGLQHAFERGIVHRDIKPSNLMLAGVKIGDANDEARTWLDAPPGSVVLPTVKILDFGLARFESESDEGKERRLTQFGKMLGTIDYIAPEQASDSRNADIRADIYSLGCTLYTLLTGQPAFPGDDLVQKLLARQDGEPPGVRGLRPDVPAPLEAVIKKMMARRPEDRYQTPAEVATALQPFTPAPTVNLSAETKSLPPTEPGKLVPPENIPLAAPVATVPEGEPAGTLLAAQPLVEADPLAFGDLDHLPEPAPAPRRQAVARGGVPRVLLAGGAIVGLVALLGLGWVLRGLFVPAPPKKGYYNPGAALQIQKVFLSNFDQPLRPGDRKNIIVEIRRAEFEGPVRIFVDKNSLPEGLNAGSATIAEKRTKGELSLTVSYGTDPLKADVKVLAVAENLKDEAALPVSVVEGK